MLRSMLVALGVMSLAAGAWGAPATELNATTGPLARSAQAATSPTAAFDDLTTAGLVEIRASLEEQAASSAAASWRALVAAAVLGDRPMIARLKAGGTDVNVIDPESGLSALHMMVMNQLSTPTRLLLLEGANANVREAGEGPTPLWSAVNLNNAEIVSIMLEFKANPNVTDADLGLTPLHSAALDGQTTVTRLLIEAGGNVNAQDRNGVSPLHLAATYGHAETLTALLDGGAQVDIPSRQGVTPLAVALRDKERNAEAIALLRAHGAAEPAATPTPAPQATETPIPPPQRQPPAA